MVCGEQHCVLSRVVAHAPEAAIRPCIAPAHSGSYSRPKTPFSPVCMTSDGQQEQ